MKPSISLDSPKHWNSSLPDCPNPEKAVEFCALPNWSCATESAWSILNKFQWLNRLPYPLLLRAIGRPEPIDTEPGIDLRFDASVDVQVLSSNFRIPVDHVKRGFPPIHDREIVRLIFARLLRYCPTCLHGGFHATVHQCLLLPRCPIHNLPLRQHCPSCRRVIAYRMDASSGAHPYACPSCHVWLAPPLHLGRGKPALPNWAQIALLDGWMRFLQVQINAISLAPRPFGISDAVYCAGIFERLGWIREAQMLFRSAPPTAASEADARRRLARRWLAARGEDRANLKSRSGLHYTKHYWYSFRGDYAHLEHRYTTTVSALACRLAAPIPPRNTNEPSHAFTIGVACFTLWRMAWEGVVHPDLLDRQLHPAFGIGIWLAHHRDAPTRAGERAKLMKDFDASLERTLATAIAVAQFMRLRGTYLFDRRLIVPAICDSAQITTFANQRTATH
jgi:hypothetical protein